MAREPFDLAFMRSVSRPACRSSQKKPKKREKGSVEENVA